MSGLILEQIDLIKESEKCFKISRELNRNYPFIRFSEIQNISKEEKKYLQEKSNNLTELINIFLNQKGKVLKIA